MTSKQTFATTLACVWTLAVAGAHAGMDARAAAAQTVPAWHFDHATWNRLVSEYVDDRGRVAYADLQDNDAAALREYLHALAKADPDDWPAAEQIAFWINAYNAGIVSAVLQGESAESLIGRGKLFKLWKFEVAGKRRTLDEIEHKILRKQFTEPRIHFAIVCASTSCPPLRSEAYVPARLDSQLEDQARVFVNDPARNRFDPAADTVEISKIFDWFQGDFERDGPLLHFLARYVTDARTREWLRTATDIRVEHLDYDWTLNAQPGERPERRSHFQ